MEKTGNKIRAFVAVEISSEAKNEIERIIKYLKTSKIEAKWVDPAVMHGTLKFLGSVEIENIYNIAFRMRDILSKMDPFKISLSAIGTFPENKHPRAVWVGIDDKKRVMEKLHIEINKLIKEEGIISENRTFKPHITLCRIKSPKNTPRLSGLIKAVKILPIVSFISEIVIFRSDLSPEGAVHTPLCKIPLGK